MEKDYIKVEDFLKSQPEVSLAAVEEVTNVDGKKDLVAYVTANKKEEKGKSSPEKAKVRLWAKVYDLSYYESVEEVDPEFNTAIWTSNYTGEPIPQEEMKEWVATAVERILEASPTGSIPPKVLEVGCGTGLLLYSLLPHVSEYAGVDNSEVAVELIENTCKGKANASKVKLFVADADDLSGIPNNKYDIIVINSVAQYFPSVEYLISVISGLKPFMADKCTLFIGDVNSYPMFDAFHSETQLTKVSPEMKVGELVEIITQLKREKGRETFFDPRLFHLLPGHFKWINSAETRLRKGEFHNEMNNFRYDVILKCGMSSDADEKKGNIVNLDWETENLSLEKVQEILAKGGYDILKISNIPNARTVRSAKLLKLLPNVDHKERVGVLLERLSKEISSSPGIEPQLFWNLKDSKYNVEVDWNYDEWNGKMSVRCTREKESAVNVNFKKLLITESSNRPAIADPNSSVLKELKNRVSENLPIELQPEEIYLISAEMFALFKDNENNKN